MLAALQEEAGEPGVYAALLELLVMASLDELAVLADLPASDITPTSASISSRRRAACRGAAGAEPRARRLRRFLEEHVAELLAVAEAPQLDAER